MKEAEEEARSIANNLIDAVNKYSFDNASFANEITTSHRTLQQSAMRAFVECIKEWADDYEAGAYDLRNEDTVRLCRDIVEQFGDRLYLRFV